MKLTDRHGEEQELVAALDEFAQDESNQRISQQHGKETRQHVERLEEGFDEFGESLEAEGGQILNGLVKEHPSFLRADPSEQINSAYQNFIKMANAPELPENAVQSL